MGDVLIGRGWRLHYLRDQRAADAMADGHTLEDVARSGQQGALAWVLRPRLHSLNHLVLASDCRTGQAIGLMAACDRVTAGCERFLLIESAMIVPGFGALPNRMLAMLLTRGAEPGTAIALRPGNPAMRAALHAAERHIPGAVFEDGNQVVVRLRTASLLRRIERGAGPGGKPALLDLRDAGKDAITDGARRLYQTRERRSNPATLLANPP